MSSMSGIGTGFHSSDPNQDPVSSEPDMEFGYPLQRFPSVEQIFRLPSFECIRRMSSIEDIRRMVSIESMQEMSTDDSSLDAKRLAPRLEDYEMACVDESEGEEDESQDSTTLDQSVDFVLGTPIHDPIDACGDFEVLDERRPWEEESSESLNSIPSGFAISEKEFNLSLGDLRVLARFHVQKAANAKGLKLPAGMTNSELAALADSLGLYPLVYRLHLEAAGRIPVSELHQVYLDYKKESKVRAKANKAKRELGLASKTRITDDGKITIDYYEGIALRLGRERDTIFRPLLHKVFREFRDHIRPKLAQAGLAYNEMRRWRDTQLCTALWVSNQFVDGIWQAAVDVHLSKTKDFT